MKCPKCGKEVFTWVSPPMECDCDKTEGGKMKCKCGFQFSDVGEFRNCAAFITKDGEGGITCPDCGRNYVDGQEVIIEEELNDQTD